MPLHVDPLSFSPRPAAKERTWDVTDDNGKPIISFTLTALGPHEIMAVMGALEDNRREYVTGTGIPDTEDYEAPRKMPLIAGVQPVITMDVCDKLTWLVAAQKDKGDLALLDFAIAMPLTGNAGVAYLEAYDWLWSEMHDPFEPTPDSPS